MCKNIEAKIKSLDEERTSLLQQLADKRANLKFKCGCGKMHKIKDCVAIQAHYYVPPSGCSYGSYWNDGEVQIICPATDVKNRIMFQNYDVEWSNRGYYNFNAEKQFKQIYKSLFESVIEDHNTDKRGWWNNYYFDENHAKFGLHIEGRDYSRHKKNKTKSLT